jgi:hypothetical protein
VGSCVTDELGDNELYDFACAVSTFDRASIGYAQRAFRTYALKFDGRCFLNSSWIERWCCPDVVDHAQPISLGHARFVLSASPPCVDHLRTAHRISTLSVILGSHLSHSHPHQRYL